MTDDDDMIPRSEAQMPERIWAEQDPHHPDTHVGFWDCMKNPPGDLPDFEYVAADVARREALAMVAVAYEDAAKATDYRPTSGMTTYMRVAYVDASRDVEARIRTRIPTDALAALEGLREDARRDLLPWARLGWAVMEAWPGCGIDGGDLQEMAERFGVISEVPGGYDPDHHIDTEGVAPDRGDPWFEMTFAPAAIRSQDGES